MDLMAAKMIGAGLASIALIGAGVGIGIIFGNYLAGALRNPGAAQGQFTNLLVGFALCEFTGLLGRGDGVHHSLYLTIMAAQPVNTATEATPRGGLPQMDTGTFPSQIFWLVVTFGLLFLVLWRITLPMIEGVIGDRRNRIEGDLGAAEKLRQQAAEALASL